MCFARSACIFLLLGLLAGCGDNLIPSGEDKRPLVQQGSTGPAVGQKAPDFALPDTSGATVTLTSALAARKGIVLYFTMWCPICDAHMSNMRSNVVPSFPAVGFYLIDYVSGTYTEAGNAAAASGYVGGAFTTLADTGQLLLNSFQATMGTTVVIDSSGIVRMNEDFKDGSRLQSVLAALP